MFKAINKWIDDYEARQRVAKKVARIENLRNRNRALEIDLARLRATLDEIQRWVSSEATPPGKIRKTIAQIDQETELKGKIAAAEKELELNKAELLTLGPAQ